MDLDRLAEPGDGSDRWNDPGIPTVYLASDPGVALAEFARHHAPEDRAERRLACLQLGPLQLADLTDPRSRVAAGVRGGPEAFLDRELARGIARRLRADPRWAGLFVPSMAFLDHPQRANLVLFPERLAGRIQGTVVAWSEAGRLLVDRPGQSPRTTGG
jgi:RES domain-containing protein